LTVRQGSALHEIGGRVSRDRAGSGALEQPSMPPSLSAKPLSISATDWLLLLMLSVLWGGSFYFTKIAVLEIPPMTLAFGRVAIAALALAIFTRAMGERFPRDASTWWNLTMMAAFNNVVPFTLIFWGQIHITIGLAGILNATSPLFAVVIAHLMTHDDRLSGGRIAGLIAGFIGVVVLIGPDLLTDLGTNVLAELACLAGSCFFALGAVMARRVRGFPPVVMAAGQLIMSTILLLPMVLLFDRPESILTASRTAIWAMVSLALLSSALAYLIYFRLIARAGATNALISTFLIPVTAILLGLVLLNEVVSARQLAGMAVIFIGIAAIDGRPARFIARTLRR
jgi:drug/metabolite transporter (DMT)-like permease